MKYKLISDRKKYGSEILENPILAYFFYQFQQSFENYSGQLLSTGRMLASLLPEGIIRSELETLLIDENKKEFPNFNRYVGDLERACHAAQTIQKEYDLGIGIAKKGSWLSFVFALHDFPTKNVYVMRTGDEKRFMHPLSIIQRKEIENKKILLFDNDLVTGHSVKTITDEFLANGAQLVDLLLVYKHTRQKKENYHEVKRKMKHESIIIGETAEEFIIDPSKEIPSSIGKTLSLECDFKPQRKYLTALMKQLGALT